MNKLVLTAFVALLAPGMAHAFCPTPKVLQPGPGEVTGCPVYAKTNNGKLCSNPGDLHANNDPILNIRRSTCHPDYR